MASYKLIGARYLRKYTEPSTSPVYAAATQAQRIVDTLCDVPWERVAAKDAEMTFHTDEIVDEEKKIKGLDMNVLVRDKFDAALFCAGHVGGQHRAYANAACYRYVMPDDAVGASLSSLAVRVTSDPYNAAGARIHVLTNSTGEIPTNCRECRGEDSSGQVVEDGTTVSGAAPRTSTTSSGQTYWYPTTATATLEPTGGLTLQKYLFVFVLMESYSTVRGNWIEGCSFIENKISITTASAVTGWDDGATIDLSASEDVAAGGVNLAVHSYEAVNKPLHIRSFSPSSTFSNPDRLDPLVRQWDFPASYTGKSSVCWLPGATADMAFFAWAGDDEYAPGDPFGSCPAAPGDGERFIALTRTNAVSPRLKLWSGADAHDREVLHGVSFKASETEATDNNSTVVDAVEMPSMSYLAVLNEGTSSEEWHAVPFAGWFRMKLVDHAVLPPVVRVRVVRFLVDQLLPYTVSTGMKVVLDRTFRRGDRDFIHEGDFLAGGGLDIDWDDLESEVRDNRDIIRAGGVITNMTYAVVIGDGDIEYFSSRDTSRTVHALPYTIARRFERVHTPPTAVGYDQSTGEFRWRIDGEDKWASAFGTTYTAFRICIYASGASTSGIDTATKDSGYLRMPAPTADGEYRWGAPADWAAAIAASGAKWRVFTYNAKFKTDHVGSEATVFASAS